MLKDVTDQPVRNAAPTREARLLGIAGLLPFVAGAAALWTLPPEWLGFAANALLAYAALIVSFLGGIHWGLAMPQPTLRRKQLIWGVLPSLLGWAALLLNSVWGLVLMAASLLLCYVVDTHLYRAQGLGPWLRLRAMLTAVAVASCLSAVAAVVL
jgi:hypothetical protein